MRLPGDLVVAFALASLSCGGAPERLVVHRSFVDMSETDTDGLGRLDGAVLEHRPFEVRDVAVHGDRRPTVSFEAPGRVRFRSEGAPSPELRFGIAVRPPGARLTLRVAANGRVVHEEEWKEERSWVERRIPLGPLPRQPFDLDVSFEGEKATVMLAHPRLTGLASESRPNVIVYLVDCLRADHVGAYGYRLPTTPSIDAIAKDGVVLEDVTACAPWTKPSTACLFTSLLPTFHQARTVDDVLAQDLTTLAEVFRARGYVTAAWVANPVIDPRLFSFNQGFDRWTDLRTFEERAQRSNIHDIDPDAADITRAVLPWLAEHREDTFFLYLHSLDLHYGYKRRPPFDDLFVSAESTGLERDRELYDNELAYNDSEIGKLTAGLKELGLYGDTILLVTADHGEEFENMVQAATARRSTSRRCTSPGS
jgi:hypothetical protein